MKLIFIAFVAGCLFACFIGCDKTKRPPPTIEVDQIDTTEWAGVTINFLDHTLRNRGMLVELDTPDKIVAYKKQVEFLLKRLEEAELRANTHEPEPELEVDQEWSD